MPWWNFRKTEIAVRRKISSIDIDATSDNEDFEFINPDGLVLQNEGKEESQVFTEYDNDYTQFAPSSEQSVITIVSGENTNLFDFALILNEFEFIKDDEIAKAKQEEKVKAMREELTALQNKGEEETYSYKPDVELIKSYDEEFVKLLVEIEDLIEENLSLETKAITKSHVL